jgi:hypothetical protein
MFYVVCFSIFASKEDLWISSSNGAAMTNPYLQQGPSPYFKHNASWLAGLVTVAAVNPILAVLVSTMG